MGCSSSKTMAKAVTIDEPSEIDTVLNISNEAVKDLDDSVSKYTFINPLTIIFFNVWISIFHTNLKPIWNFNNEKIWNFSRYLMSWKFIWTNSLLLMKKAKNWTILTLEKIYNPWTMVMFWSHSMFYVVAVWYFCFALFRPF